MLCVEIGSYLMYFKDFDHVLLNMLPKNRNLGATVIADFVKKCGDALLCLEELPLCFFSLNTANDALQL